MPTLSGAAAVVGLLTLAGGIVVGAGGRFCEHSLPRGLTQPGLAIEVVGLPADVDKVIGQDVCVRAAAATQPPRCRANRETLAAQQGRDAFFIPAYVLFFVLVGAMTWRIGGWARLPGLAAMLLAAGAGVADVQEDRIILALLGAEPSCAVMPRPWALAKWWMLSAVLALNIPLFVPRCEVRGVGRWFGYAAAVLGVAAVYFAGMHLRSGDDTYLETALPVVAAAVLATWVGVAARAWFPTGLLAGLDAAASRPWLRRVANWPSDEDDAPEAGAR